MREKIREDRKLEGEQGGEELRNRAKKKGILGESNKERKSGTEQ